MNAAVAFGGGVFLADKSAWVRAQHQAVQDEWQRALVIAPSVTDPVDERDTTSD